MVGEGGDRLVGFSHLLDDVVDQGLVGEPDLAAIDRASTPRQVPRLTSSCSAKQCDDVIGRGGRRDLSPAAVDDGINQSRGVARRRGPLSDGDAAGLPGEERLGPPLAVTDHGGDLCGLDVVPPRACRRGPLQPTHLAPRRPSLDTDRFQELPASDYVAESSHRTARNHSMLSGSGEPRVAA